MRFFEIELLSVPEINFACSVALKNYSNRFSEIPRILEMGLCDEGRIVWDYDDGRCEIDCPKMFGAITCLTKASTRLFHEDEIQRHTTVGVYADYKIREYSGLFECDIKSLRERMKNSYIVLIPTNTYLDEYYEPVLKAFRKTIDSYMVSDITGIHQTVSDWFALAGLLTKFVLSRLEAPVYNVTPSENSYAEKAIKYIDNNYVRQLTVEEIASSLGISKGYLQWIFRKVRNMGVLEYINKKRVSVAIDLMLYKNATLQEAGYNVGIDDRPVIYEQVV